MPANKASGTYNCQCLTLLTISDTKRAKKMIGFFLCRIMAKIICIYGIVMNIEVRKVV